MAIIHIPLRETLQQHTKEGLLFRRVDEDMIECFACGHRCKIREGRDGICHIRFNKQGTLMVPHGYVAGLQVDPIEKKPFFHAYPGSKAMSFGMLGCDLHCAYCQNWITSQALADPSAGSDPQFASPEQIVNLARAHKARVLTSTYNEPLITSEWAMEIFALAKPAGFVCSYVSNGNGTPEVIDFVKPYVDLYKIDLKSFNDKSYRKLGTTLRNVTDTISRIHAEGIWLEIVSLIVPTFNDSPDELRDMASFIASVSVDIPWHVTAFHPDYKMTEPDQTSSTKLIEAAKIGHTAGLRYVYAGNLPGKLGNLENTYCHACQHLLVERTGFHVISNRIDNGRCPTCKTPIPGRWSSS